MSHGLESPLGVPPFRRGRREAYFEGAALVGGQGCDTERLTLLARTVISHAVILTLTLFPHDAARAISYVVFRWSALPFSLMQSVLHGSGWE
jgi:hypothetical protein